MKILVFVLLTLTYDARSLNLGGHVCQKMWNDAENNLIIPGELAVNEGNNLNPVFTLVHGAGAQGHQKLQSEEFTRFHDILVDYQAQPYVLNQQHINDFISAITQPCGPVEAAFSYLKTQANALPVDVTTLDQFRTTLKSLWFTDSNGFRHVFVGEQFQHKVPKEIRYKGFQNWYQYYTEENKQNGIQKQNPPTFVMDKRPTFIKDLKFKWKGKSKQGSTDNRMFVGTSPSFELALFTTCLLKGRGIAGGAHPPPGPYRTTNCDCTIHVPGIGDSTVEVKTVENQKGKVVTAVPTNVH